MPSQLFYLILEMPAVLISCLGLAAWAFARFTACDVDGFRLKDCGAVLLPGPECSLRRAGYKKFSNCIGRLLATVPEVTLGRDAMRCCLCLAASQAKFGPCLTNISPPIGFRGPASLTMIVNLKVYQGAV